MSSSIRSRKHTVNPYALVMAATALALPVAALADADADQDHKGTEVTIKGERHVPYKTDKASSPKKTEALVDTPQTMSVISKELLQDQGATSLVDALRNTPGITMQLGENGNTAAGDTFQLRGFSAQNSIFLDGVRDIGAVSRDVFNIEQVEIAKGPAGSDVGRGASSGYINLVSKLPTLNGGRSATLSAYAQGGLRATADVNIATGETSAFRLNIMDQDVNVAGRDYVKNSGYGIAPSFAIGLGTDTRFYVFAQVIHQDNVPDGGISAVGYKGFFNTNATLDNAPRVNHENYYGSVNDYEKVDAAMLTGKVEHSFANGATLVNTTRYGQNSMDRVLTGVNAITATNLADPSTWTVSRSRQRVDQENTILINTTNLNLTVNTGAWEHDLAIGTEIAHETRVTRTYAVTPNTTPATPAVVIPAANLYNPNPNDALPPLFATGAFVDGQTNTFAAYVFDTIKVNDKLLLNAGLRLDNYSLKSTQVSVAATTPYAQTVVTPGDSGTLASWNIGAVYKPRHNGSIYIAYGTSLTPPGGDTFTPSTSGTSIANPNFDPVEVGNFEIGTKWDLFRKKLSLTGAYYSTVAKNELAVTDPVTNVVTQIGERKVSGFEFGAVGQLSPVWQISAGVQTMDTEITKGSTGNSSTGAATRWSPDLTATVWTTYQISPKFTIGGGVNYTSEQLRVIDPSANPATTAGLSSIPEYWVVNAMAAYQLSPRLALQLNVYNVTDEDYISTLNNGGSRLTIGAPLTGTLTLSVKF